MFSFLSSAGVFHIVQLMRTTKHQSYYDCVSHNVHKNAVVIISGSLLIVFKLVLSLVIFNCMLYYSFIDSFLRF